MAQIKVTVPSSKTRMAVRARSLPDTVSLSAFVSGSRVPSSRGDLTYSLPFEGVRLLWRYLERDSAVIVA